MARRRQQPAAQFTDLFKCCGVDGWPRGDFERTGDASVAVDRAIGRPVVRLAGAVPAANSLRLPRQRDASLGSSHRFLYLQMRMEPGKTYAVHADYTTTDRAQQRLTISNLYGGQAAVARARRAGGLHIYLPAVQDAWTLLAVDLQGVADAASGGGGAVAGGSPFRRLRALTLCANMTVRGAFTSDVVYDWSTLPADLAFSAAFDATQARVLWVPGGPPEGAQVAAPRARPTSPRPALPQCCAAPPTRQQKRVLPVQGDEGVVQQQLTMQPAPTAQLQRVAAFSGRHPGLLHWVPGMGNSGKCGQEIVFAAGSLIVSMQAVGNGTLQGQQPQQQQQRHLQGHTAAVRALAVSADGSRLASAEEGAGTALRLWDLQQGLCIATLPGHAAGTTCLDLSPDGCLLASAGLDAQGRQELVCWDVSACRAAAGSSSGASGSRVRELARQMGEYNVQALKFMPHQPGQLVTCGKNSIRVHRLKDGQLRSLSVKMEGVPAARQRYSCGTQASLASPRVGEVFTCLAFEQPLRERPLAARRLYAGTTSGTVYTVDLESRLVECVTQVHSAAVLTLEVHDGFCVTGSADRCLRLWGSDLREAYMEAAHEGSVTGVGVSPDGLWVAAGTASGAVSLLDISSSKYTTLLRSHTAAVHAVAVLGQPPGQGQELQYCTAGADGTVRVWSSTDHQQVLELCAPGETVLSIAGHPSKTEVACGFRGGSLRIFDAASAALVQESRQHTGAVSQLAFARHGRTLLSLGEDGCVCAYDAQRSYMPTTFVLAGFPLHGTTMAVSADGQLLATAALSLQASSSSSPWGSQPASPAARKQQSSTTDLAQPVIVLHNTVSMQPTLQFAVAGTSRVAQLQLQPDGRQLLALTEDGRLLGYSCADGSLVLDVPRCLTSPCLAAALDPSGTFLVAGAAGGQLKVWGLHSLHRLPLAGRFSSQGQQQEQTPAALATVRSLPSQQLNTPAGSAVLGMAFLTPRQLLTVGSAGEVCCWDFLGEPCNSCTANGALPDVVTAGTVVVMKQVPPHQQQAASTCQRPLQQVQMQAEAGALTVQQPQLQPAFNWAADCSGPRYGGALPASSRPTLPGPTSVQWGQQQQMSLQQQATLGSPSAGASSPAPRPLPAALQHLPPRPPSAPAVPRRQDAAAAWAAAGNRQQSASLPGTPVHGRSKVPPIWERQPQQPEASLLITATPGKRCTQVVRQQKQLQVTAPANGVGGSGVGSQQRAAEWLDAEVAGDRVPVYRPEQQLQLVPPTAAVKRVCGFHGHAGFGWLPAGRQQVQQPLLYIAGNVLLSEELSTAQQRHLARLPRDITALAATADGRVAAAAVAPAAADGSTADIHLFGLRPDTADGLSVLSHHSFPVQTLAFSPEGSLLAAVSCSPDGGSCSLALWSVEEPADAELVAGVELPEPVAGLAWEPRAAVELPTFYTTGSQGLVQWQLGPEELSSTVVHLPAALRGVVLTAVATCAPEADGEGSQMCRGSGNSSTRSKSSSSTVYVGDGSGRVWQLEVDCGQDVRRSQVLAEVQGQAVSCLCAAGPHLLAVGTASGSVLLLAEEGWSEKEATWKLLSGEQLDGAVIGLQLDQGSRQATATTACGTLWRVDPSSSGPPQVLLCGQPHSARGWHLAVGAAWKGAPPAAAVASAAGVAVWQLGEAAGSTRAPLVEFPLLADATHVCLAEDASICAAAYGDGSICLFDVAAARLRWRVAGAAAQGGVAAIAIVQRLRGCKVMVAYRSGALFVLDGGSGQVAHRTLQFAMQQESGRMCPGNFRLAGLVVHPKDSALFALCGQQELLVCRAAWTKNADVTPLARLSFSPADRCGSSAGIVSQQVLLEGGQGDAPPAVQAAFSRAHAGHIYCSNPTAPGQVLLFDYSTQAVVKTLLATTACAAGITALALHPSEALLAAGTTAGSVLLLRLETESWAELAAHAEGAPVAGVAFSACGSRLFSAAAGASTTFVWGLGP